MLQSVPIDDPLRAVEGLAPGSVRLRARGGERGIGDLFQIGTEHPTCLFHYGDSTLPPMCQLGTARTPGYQGRFDVSQPVMFRVGQSELNR